LKTCRNGRSSKQAFQVAIAATASAKRQRSAYFRTFRGESNRRPKKADFAAPECRGRLHHRRCRRLGNRHRGRSGERRNYVRSDDLHWGATARTPDLAKAEAVGGKGEDPIAEGARGLEYVLGLIDGENVGRALRLRRLDQIHVHPRLARQKERKSEKLASDRQST
jgi:hypothetical protein